MDVRRDPIRPMDGSCQTDCSTEATGRLGAKTGHSSSTGLPGPGARQRSRTGWRTGSDSADRRIAGCRVRPAGTRLAGRRDPSPQVERAILNGRSTRRPSRRAVEPHFGGSTQRPGRVLDERGRRGRRSRVGAVARRVLSRRPGAGRPGLVTRRSTTARLAGSRPLGRPSGSERGPGPRLRCDGS